MNSESETVAQTRPFQAEVAQLLHLMVHAVYSETEVFLRELVSNASDACDKLRYEAIAKPELLADGAGLIGKFGVGFYSAFMVADRIEVTSTRAGAGEAWVWRASGGEGFEIA